MDGKTPAHPWSARYLLGRNAKIEQDLPFIEFDWGGLGKYFY
jgi:hypothetical protein